MALTLKSAKKQAQKIFFLFGLTAEQVYALKADGYNPKHYYENNADLKGVIDRIEGGYFSHGDRDLFKPIVDSLLYSDPYMLLADYQAYSDCQEKVSQTYRDTHKWTQMSILNAARMGKFSSDRTIREYCKEIWEVKPIAIDLNS
ncbi:MAG: glycogen/starch/alpha-glucan phosphorylase [Hydrococcus sp. CSU_1_8]|nr:glycogen/starch/alpha-glucan phosphorylase [Hydrococcus sp. CSU_1_8]